MGLKVSTNIGYWTLNFYFALSMHALIDCSCITDVLVF